MKPKLLKMKTITIAERLYEVTVADLRDLVGADDDEEVQVYIVDCKDDCLVSKLHVAVTSKVVKGD